MKRTLHSEAPRVEDCTNTRQAIGNLCLAPENVIPQGDWIDISVRNGRRQKYRSMRK